MPIDAPVVMLLSKELNAMLPVKVDKIHQPYPDEFIFQCYGSGENFKILISLNYRYGRVTLFHGVKENPASPSAFCMLLRKHFGGSKLVKIEAVPFERISKFTFEVYDQFSGLTKKTIWVELTGKSSNLIITDEKGLIIDFWKKKVPGQSHPRDLANGVKYELPNTQGRWQPVTLDLKQFKTLINEIPPEITLDKILFKHWYGLSPLALGEITRRAGFEPETPCGIIPEMGIEKLYEVFKDWSSSIAEDRFEPVGIYDGINRPVEFAAFTIKFPPDDTVVKKVSLLNPLVDEIMNIKHETERLNEYKHNLRQKILAKIEKNKTKLAKQEQEASVAEKSDIFRIMGELLITYGYKIPKGTAEIKLPNHYDPSGEEMCINLNPAFTASDNAQIYFKKYQKAKKGQISIANQLNKTRETLDYLESIETMILNALTPADINLVELEVNQLDQKNTTPKKNVNIRVRQERASSKKEPPVKPREFQTPSGHLILVGRNNFQNDFLTLKVAAPNDLWFHTQKIPGSHVILKSNPGTPLDDESLSYACQLAVFFSKAKNSSKIPVDYTPRKNVKKPAGSKPGFVIYDFFKTAIIDPDLALLKELGLL